MDQRTTVAAQCDRARRAELRELKRMKAKARANEDIPTKTAVLNEIR